MDMNKTNSSIDENEESLVGEVLSDDEVREKKQAIAKWQHSPVGFGSYITKSNDLIQRTKYSLPRNEQKVLFMLMSKIDQKNDKDASKYYSITFNDFGCRRSDINSNIIHNKISSFHIYFLTIFIPLRVDIPFNGGNF